jgi:membrane protein DedA with SNARE-associated domain
MLIAGETVYIPALYASFLGYIDLKWLLIDAFVATFITDYLLYLLGKKIPLEKIVKYSWLKRKTLIIEKFQTKFNKHAFLVFLFSKFFYGTRAAAQIFYGLHKIPTWKYVILNSLSIIIWLLILYILGLGLNSSLLTWQASFKQIEFLGAGIFLIFMIGFIWIFRIITKKELSQ